VSPAAYSNARGAAAFVAAPHHRYKTPVPKRDDDKAEFEPTHVAAIDVGSNGIRMVIGEIDDDARLTEVESVRESVRLGEDAFRNGKFADATIGKAVKAFERFSKLMAEHEVSRCRAVATAAMRESSNGRDLARAVREATGIKLEIINGLEEAQLVFTAVAHEVDLGQRTALLVDMGGGSVEVTVARNGHAMASESLRLGPVRLLQKLREKGLEEDDAAQLIAKFRGNVAGLVRGVLEDHEHLDVCIGTGGNIETLGRLRTQLLPKIKTGKVKLADLEEMVEKLLKMKVSQRVDKLGLRPDRADVIAIAAMVVRMIMQDADVPRMLCPGVGLKDGLLRQLADDVIGGKI
jgi:exopolyphosphatase/guanosine-5'-triphosphate,3'-diphosphate pyrophosphatase